MNLQPSHHDAFPSLVTSFDIEGHDDQAMVMEMINKYRDFGDHKLVHEGQSSYINGDEQFLNDVRLVNLWKTIQECLDLYTQASGIDYSLISTSWFNSLYQGGSVDAHRHERSIVSGAYYPYVDNGSSPLLFENPMTPYFMNQTNIQETPYNKYELECFPKTGLLVLFPSWMRHRVPANITEKRYTVSFNTIRRADRANLMKIRDYRIEPHESTES